MMMMMMMMMMMTMMMMSLLTSLLMKQINCCLRAQFAIGTIGNIITIDRTSTSL